MAEEYVDTGISGVKEHRPALDRLLRACRRRLIDAVVVYLETRTRDTFQTLANRLFIKLVAKKLVLRHTLGREEVQTIRREALSS